jgi:hypothetical protein
MNTHTMLLLDLLKNEEMAGQAERFAGRPGQLKLWCAGWWRGTDPGPGPRWLDEQARNLAEWTTDRVAWTEVDWTAVADGIAVPGDNSFEVAGLPGERWELEPVAIKNIAAGDTVLMRNSWGAAALRYVEQSGADKLNAGAWTVKVARPRDVPGPGEEHTPTISSDGLTMAEDDTMYRLKGLSRGQQALTTVYRLQKLDRIIWRGDKHVVWQVADQVDSHGMVMVRFAREDDFRHLPPSRVFVAEIHPYDR